MNNYTLGRVATYLLYDALSWMIKTGLPHTLFYRMEDGKREDCIATAIMIKEELRRREFESADMSIKCQFCGLITDGRTVWGNPPRQPVCPVCYFARVRGLVSDIEENANMRNTKAMAMPPVQESREDIAKRMGISLEMLEANGYFD